MLNDILHWLIATFVIAPVQTEIDRRLQAAPVPQAVVQQVRSCVVTATPQLVRRATSDWVWGTSTAFSMATGYTNPLQVLSDEAPVCREAVSAFKAAANARPA